VQVLYVTATDGDLKGFNVRFASGACGYVIFDLSVTNSALNGFNVGFASDDYGYFVPYRKGSSGEVARVELPTLSQVRMLDLTATDSDLKHFLWRLRAGRLRLRRAVHSRRDV